MFAPLTVDTLYYIEILIIGMITRNCVLPLNYYTLWSIYLVSLVYIRPPEYRFVPRVRKGQAVRISHSWGQLSSSSSWKTQLSWIPLWLEILVLSPFMPTSLEKMSVRMQDLQNCSCAFEQKPKSERRWLGVLNTWNSLLQLQMKCYQLQRPFSGPSKEFCIRQPPFIILPTPLVCPTSPGYLFTQ